MKVVNFLTTLSLFVMAIQFYVVEPKVAMAQTNESASEELENGQTEKEAQYLETEDERIREEHQRGEPTYRDRVRQRRGGGTGTLEEKRPEGIRIEDVRSPDVGEGNLPAEPPINEVKIEL